MAEIDSFNIEVNTNKQLLSSETKIFKTEKFFYQTKKLSGIDKFVLKIAEKRDAGVVANMAIVVICQAMFLLDRQLERLTADFIQNGGALERFIRAHREQKRRKKDDGK